MRKYWTDTIYFPGLVVLAGLSCIAVAEPVRAAAPDLPDASAVTRRMMERAQSVASAGPATLYTYDKRALREELDSDGTTVQSEERMYRVDLIAGFPFNRLVGIQGRDLSRAELLAEGEREEKFRQKLLAANFKQMAARKEGWVTPQLLDRFEFAVQERIVHQGRPTLVLNFRPKPGAPPADNMRDKVLERLTGTLWVDEADADTAQLSVRLLAPLSVGWLGIFGSLSRCELLLERQRMPDGVWINNRQVLRIQYRKLTTTRHFRTTEHSSRFQKAPSS